MENSNQSVFNQMLVGGIESVRVYINQRFYRWQDYAKFHCSKAGIEDEMHDLLNEVMVSLLAKNEAQLIKLYQKENNNGYRDLDFMVLRMIKLNVYSKYSPYQFRYHYHENKYHRGVEIETLPIVYEEYEESDKPGQILKEMRLIRYVFDRIEIDEIDRKVFIHCFFNGESAKTFTGVSLYSTRRRYQFVSGIIHEIIFRLGKTSIKPVKTLNKEQVSVSKRFFNTHKITFKSSTFSEN